MDKTYAETRNKPPFDWNKWLDSALRGEVSRVDYTEKRQLTQNWVTCACGNQCAIIPRNPVGEPEDADLAHYGKDFYSQVSSATFAYTKEKRTFYLTLAKETLAKIETRATELIAIELQKLRQSA